MRGITYFRTFQPTRYLIAMIIAVIKDIIPFFVLLVYSGVAVSVLFYVLSVNRAEEFQLYKVNFQGAFMLPLGEFMLDEFDSSPWLWIVFSIAALLNLIVMMNLLISIIGDTFDKVQMDASTEDTEAKIDLTLETYVLLFWRRSTSDKRWI